MKVVPFPNRLKETVVIVNYNGIGYLKNCILSIMKQTSAPDELMVVDNGSTDGSTEMLSRIFPQVVIHRLNGNPGLTAAYNAGLQRARNDWVVLANNDIVLHPDCLELLRGASTSPETVVVPQFVSMKAPHKVQTYPVRFVPSIRNPWSSARIHPMTAGNCMTDIAPFGLLMLNRRRVERIHSAFPYYFNEDDFSLARRRRGGKIIFVPGAIVFHYGSATLGKLNLKKIRLFLDGWTRFRAKWVSPWLLLPSIYFAAVVQVYEHLVRAFFSKSVTFEQDHMQRRDAN